MQWFKSGRNLENFKYYINFSMLTACTELLGNLLGDWTSDEILDYFSKIWIDKLTNGQVNGAKTPAKRNGGALEGEKNSKVRVVRQESVQKIQKFAVTVF